MNKKQGFTLIELMIVIVILGIISVYAFMNTSDHVKKSHRAEAKSMMLQVAHQQERYFTENNTYGSMTAIGNPSATLTTDSGNHEVTVSLSNNDMAYTITATPLNTDSECGNLTLTDTNVRGSSINGNCW